MGLGPRLVSSKAWGLGVSSLVEDLGDIIPLGNGGPELDLFLLSTHD